MIYIEPPPGKDYFTCDRVYCWFFSAVPFSGDPVWICCCSIGYIYVGSPCPHLRQAWIARARETYSSVRKVTRVNIIIPCEFICYRPELRKAYTPVGKCYLLKSGAISPDLIYPP